MTAALDQQARDTQVRSVESGAPPPPPGANEGTPPIDEPPRAGDALLLIYADALDDLERTRIANENRVRSLRQVKGLDDTPEAARLDAVVAGLADLEHRITLDLQRAMRAHPLGPWMKATVGIGMKQGARLLAAIGDPADRRTVSQLWAYCGLHVWRLDHSGGDTQPLAVEAPSSPGGDAGQVNDDAHVGGAGVAPRRTRGAKANWSTTAKMRAYLVAESCIKQARSPYRVVYDGGRAKYAEAVHAVECVRCGPSSKPAAVGSPLSAGHQHARAMRLVMKAVLRDLWVEARRLRTAAALDAALRGEAVA